MTIGHFVGIFVAVVCIFGGSVAIVKAKKKGKKGNWGQGAILFGISALLSAVINYHLFK